MPVLNLNQIKTIDDFPNIVLLYGKDSFSIDETYRKILSFFHSFPEHTDNIEVIDGEEKDYFIY